LECGLPPSTDTFDRYDVPIGGIAWHVKDGAEVSVGSEKVSSREYERMRRELAKVKAERDILKKALGYFAADLK